MRKLLVTILLLLATTSIASQKAITDKGEEVILNSNGTWQYSDNVQKATIIITTNKKKFERPKDSSFLLKSTRNNSAYWVNTDKWFFEKPKDKATAEYQFQRKGEDLYGTVINEGFELALETLADIAFRITQSAAPDTKMVRQEYRVVNGKKVICMEMNCTMHGHNFTYIGYYYSNSSGSTQIVTYTSTSLLSKYESEMYDFLNGLVAQ